MFALRETLCVSELSTQIEHFPGIVRSRLAQKSFTGEMHIQRSKTPFSST